MADESENRITVRDLAAHPMLAEFRKETRYRLKQLEELHQRSLEKVAGLDDRTAGQRQRLEAAERAYGEVNLAIGEIKDRWRERNERFAALENRIDEMEKLTKAVAESAFRAHEILRRTAWSIAGGTAVITFVVGLWTLFIGPLLSALVKV